LPGDKLNLKPG